MVHVNWPQLRSELGGSKSGSWGAETLSTSSLSISAANKTLFFWGTLNLPEMTDKKGEPIMGCDFEIRGKVPKEAFELFALAQAKSLGLRGFITQVSEEVYKGQLQGEGKVIEAFKKLILAAAEYVQAIKEFVIKNLKAIEEYTYKTFEIKVDKK
uniref:Acylphosphatase-1 n=2 Tax=Drosophila rhopaloa TaxID=1041015 RepID=A0A6P4F2V4_DRORH